MNNNLSKSKLKLSIIFALLVLLINGIVISTASAQSPAVISVGNATGEKGEIVEVVVYIENASGMEGGELVLSYNPDVVKPKQVKKGGLISSSF